VPAPRVAVVIPSRRGPRLAFALEALAAQTLPTAEYEVVVVRDPASDRHEPVPAGELEVRFLHVEQECGPTRKRNAGWRSTNAPLVAFTDDDCRPRNDWLERLLSAWGEQADAFVQGRTEPDADEHHLLHGLARSQLVAEPSVWFQTCNMAYPRALLERLGGFDEGFVFGGEDTDFGARALQVGARRVWAREALVWHAVIARPLPAALREAVRWPSQPLLLKRHPEYRRHLYRGFFWRRSHALVTLALAGALIASRHPALAALAVAPYVDSNLDRKALTARGVARQLAGLPSRAAVDALETAAMARAAARFRVPVL